jgi:hypothetical protein
VPQGLMRNYTINIVYNINNNNNNKVKVNFALKQATKAQRGVEI